MLTESIIEAMTGHGVSCDEIRPIAAEEYAAAIAERDAAFRTRGLQVVLLVALVLRPLPRAVTDQIQVLAQALSVDDGMLAVARRFSMGQLGLAAVDFERNGYTADWSPERATALHASTELATAWDQSVADRALHARWQTLESLPAGTLGRRVADFYLARGFAYPGSVGSAPPLLAQHDWVHVLADYGSIVESELEVFALIARANDDPKGFSLLAMVVSPFETRYLEQGAGLFEAAPGQLTHDGVTARVADVMRRGALAHTSASSSVDFLAIDWFDIAHLPLDEARAHFGIVPKSERVAALSPSAFGPGGISPFQHRTGHALAAAEGRPYDAFGATERTNHQRRVRTADDAERTRR